MSSRTPVQVKRSVPKTFQADTASKTMVGVLTAALGKPNGVRRTPNFMPATTAKVEVEAAATAEISATGRNENNNPDRCPVCNKAYIIARANGHDTRVCLDHNIVMPAKDQ